MKWSHSSEKKLCDIVFHVFLKKIQHIAHSSVLNSTKNVLKFREITFHQNKFFKISAISLSNQLGFLKFLE